MGTPSDIATRLRRAVPRGLLPVLYALRYALAWSRSGVRSDARAQMGFLLEMARPDADLDRVARDYVKYQIRRGELRWHPELITNLRVVGNEHLVEARAGGQGVILNFTHHGFYDGAFPSMARHGVLCNMVVYPYMLLDDAPAWLKQHVALACTGGGVPVSADVGNDGLVELLRRGEVVALASDVPGRTPVRFAGRDVLGSFGAARLASDTGAPVVVMTSEMDDEGPFIRLHEPLEAASFSSSQALLSAMLAIHETVQLRWPEATDLPLSRWGEVSAAAAPAPGQDLRGKAS